MSSMPALAYSISMSKKRPPSKIPVSISSNSGWSGPRRRFS
jgi:hypothetical protein